MVSAALNEFLPAELREGCFFVGWRYETRDGKPTKLPFNSRTGDCADVTNPATWTTWQAAITAMGKFGYDGLGRVVTEEQGFVGVDLDHCRNIQTGELTAFAASVVRRLNSYTEITPSGEGVRVWIHARKTGERCRVRGVEVYASERFFTLTGNHLRGTPRMIESRQTEFDALYKELFPTQPAPSTVKFTSSPSISHGDLLERIFSSAQGEKARRLWNGDISGYSSHSEADQALCLILSFWTHRNATEIDSLFRQSGLMRPKWDSRRRGSTYGADTIRNAIDLTTEVWKPGVTTMSSTKNTPIVTEDTVGWPEPKALEPELLKVEAFDERLLPVCFRSLVMDVSERMQAPPDFGAAAIVVALAGCVGRRASIRPKQFDADWCVTPNLWGGVVGPPGYLKSPMLSAITKPLVHIEEIWRKDYEAAKLQHERKEEIQKLKMQAWAELSKSRMKKGGSELEMPEKLTPPVQKRLLLADSTYEKLQSILADNPAGVLVIRDELVGWFSQLDKAGREGERSFYLESWNGYNHFTVDRIGRGSVHVPHACVGLFGNIQPSPLRFYLPSRDASLSDDGCFQRLQVLVWPDAPADWKKVDRIPDRVAQMRAEKVFTVLSNLSADAPINARFEPDAQELFNDWLAELEHKIRKNPAFLPPAVISHLSKYRSLMPSLALLFELADRASADEPIPAKLQVNLAHAQQAAALCSYLESHAHRVYNCIVSPSNAAAHRLAEHLERGHLSDTFTARDVYRKHWSGLDTPEPVRTALEHLEDNHWVRRVEQGDPSIGGRPTESWLVNPKVKGVSRGE